MLTFTAETRKLCIDQLGVDPNDAYLGFMHEIHVGGRAYQQLLAQIQKTEPPTHLTPRQLDTMRYVAQGYTTDEIAGFQVVAPETVRSAVREALRRLGARNRAHAAVLCLLLGLFEETE